MTAFLTLIVFLVSSGADASPLVGESAASRMNHLKIQASSLFFSPDSAQDKAMFTTGVYHHWQSYGKTTEPDPSRFFGYILFSDPYHDGLEKISFLLGSDCSHFIHRLFQVMGMTFPYAKTRHWIHLHKSKMLQLSGKTAEAYYQDQSRTKQPIDLSLCEWLELDRKFENVSDVDPLKLFTGDLVIFPKDLGILGEKGHMGVISKSGTVLQAKYPVGIVELPLTEKDYFVLRWRGSLNPIKGKSLGELLNMSYPFETSACREQKNSHAK